LVDGQRVIPRGLRSRVGRIVRQTATRLIGAVPYTRAGHPLHFIYQNISAALNRAERAEWSILFVGENQRFESGLRTRQPSRCFHISAADLLSSQSAATLDEPWCGLSVIELRRDDLQHLDSLGRAVLPHMRPGGRIVMFWINYDCECDELLQQAVAEAGRMEDDGADVQLIVLPQGWGGLELVGAWRNPAISRRGIALLVALLNLSRPRRFRRHRWTGEAGSGNCLGMVIDIEVGHSPHEASGQAVSADSTPVISLRPARTSIRLAADRVGL
jgi:hypothetical protein